MSIHILIHHDPLVTFKEHCRAHLSALYAFKQSAFTCEYPDPVNNSCYAFGLLLIMRISYNSGTLGTASQTELFMFLYLNSYTNSRVKY